jgi:flavin reductase (DIM6/NTAB) family NADH-FMN oxidoreductase RutF
MSKKSVGANTMAVPAPVWLVGTYDANERPNLATIAWGGICCSEPPAIAISLRAARYSYDAIMKRQAFTVNIPSETFVREADYAGIVSGRDEDKFAVAKLTPVKSTLVDAPYVAEFPLILECRLLQVVEIGVHTQFIGQIIDVKAAEEVLNANGLPDGGKVRPIVYDPATLSYFGLGQVLGKGFTIGRSLCPEPCSTEGYE